MPSGFTPDTIWVSDLNVRKVDSDPGSTTAIRNAAAGLSKVKSELDVLIDQGLSATTVRTSSASPITALVGELVRLNANGAITVNAPAPASLAEGEIFGIQVVTGDPGANNITVARNGHSTINEVAASLVLDTKGTFTFRRAGTDLVVESSAPLMLAVDDASAADGYVLSRVAGAPAWVSPTGGGNVTKVGTPADNQIGVWTGNGTIEGDADLIFDGAGALSVQATDAGTAEGPVIILDRASATPAAGDLVGQVTFRGRDSAAAPTDYGKIRGVASEVANGTEASRLQLIVLDGIGNPAESFSVKGDGVIVYKDNNDALPGPTLTIQRHSDDPAVNDKLGLISWTGRDSAGNETAYASIETAVIDPTNGSEDGELRFSVTVAGGEPKLRAFLNHAGFFHFLEDAGGAGQGPEVAIFRDSTSPTNNDLLGQLLFQGRDSIGGGVDYASVRGQILDVANGSEDGSLELRVAVAGTLTTRATLSASGLALASGTALTGLVETISGHIEAAANKTYVLDLKAPYGYTVNALAAKTASGTCTAKLTIDGVDVTGIAALSVSSTEAAANASAANAVGVDTTLALVVSANSTALDLTFSVKITR